MNNNLDKLMKEEEEVKSVDEVPVGEVNKTEWGDMPEDNSCCGGAGQSCRLHELALAQRQRLTANDARHIQPVDRADSHEYQKEISFEGDHQQDDEEYERQCA